MQAGELGLEARRVHKQNRITRCSYRTPGSDQDCSCSNFSLFNLSFVSLPEVLNFISSRFRYVLIYNIRFSVLYVGLRQMQIQHFVLLALLYTV